MAVQLGRRIFCGVILASLLLPYANANQGENHAIPSGAPEVAVPDRNTLPRDGRIGGADNEISSTAGQRGKRNNSFTVSIPNGYANGSINDIRVQSIAGEVFWTRVWDGQEWKFNPHWESLSQSWKNMTGSQTADSAASSSSTSTPVLSAGSGGGGGSEGCWVWVDEDWQPSSGTVMVGGIPQAGPMLPYRTTPFNRLMGEDSADYPPPMLVSVDYANLCMGSSQSGGMFNAEGIRRQNELYLGEEGRYAFSNRAFMEKRAVRAYPAVTASNLESSLASGTAAFTPETVAKGFRWMDKSGDWIDYNTQGQIVAWGDRNDNAIWLVRDTDGMVRGVVDSNGRVLYTLHYEGALLVKVKDYPINGNALDLPSRSVTYKYDSLNRLTEVTDVRGHVTKYEYDAANRIVKIIDPEGRSELFAYNGDSVTKHTAPDGGVTDYAFDYDDTNKQFSSKITGPETAAGRRVENFIHNRVGKLVQHTINGRMEEEVRYDTGARAELRTNARGFTTRVVKNEFDQDVEITHPDDTTVKYGYSALHLQRTEEIDEAGVKTEYQYDAKGNLLKKVEAAGTADQRVTEYEVNGLGQVVKVTLKGRTEANGTVTADATWQLEYDSAGLVKKTIDPEGHTRQYMYNRTGNLVSQTDPRGNTISYEVDTAGNLIKATDALGRSRSYDYDKVGNLTTSIDARGKTARAVYDAMNRLTQSINSVGGISKRQYNNQGLPVTETDEDGRSTSTVFDNFLRIVGQADALGNATQFDYQIPDGTASGQLGSLSEPTEVKYPTFTQQTRYDRRERPTSQTLINPAAQGTQTFTSSTTYDKRGLVKNETDAYGKARAHTYNALGQRIESTDTLGGTTRWQYDARGNLLQLTDAKSNIYTFEYDRNNRLVKQTMPLGQVIRQHYDAAGNLSERVDPKGNKFVYTYDAANRLVEIKQYKAEGTLVRTTKQTWDEADNLIAWSDTDATRPSGQQTASGSATFDDANRKTGETVSYPNPSGANTSLSYSTAYSLAGKKTRLTWPDGTNIEYGYSAHGELESVTIPGEGTLGVNQFKWTKPAQTTLPGGSTQNHTYDGLLNLEGFNVKTSDQQMVLDLANTYGKSQELKKSIRTDNNGTAANTRTSSYVYDDELRLTQAEHDTGGLFGADTESFTLDALGNRITHSKVSGAWVYDANNHLTQRGSGATTYEYDDSGNLIKKTEGAKITQYAYDAMNRLVEVKNGSNNLIARYGYDPLDRRLWKEQYRDAQGNALAPAKRTLYLYADEGLIAEASQDIILNNDGSVSASGSPAVVTQYGPRPEAEFTTGVLFIKTRNSNGQDMVAYYHHDHLQTPIQATDKQGNLVWSANYESFGKAHITTPAATADNPTIASNLRLPGQYADEETGLHYNFRRYYDPDTGRYVTEDPIGLEGGINLFLYANANSILNTDPRGENPRAIAAAILAAIKAAKEAIKKCAGDKKCRCNAIHYSYAVVCRFPASCKPTDDCGPVLDAKESAARWCFNLRDLYIRSGCDSVIPTKADHPKERDKRKENWEKCKARQASCKKCNGV